MRGEMKFMKKSQTYKSSNVEFNPSSFEATSYKWWHFVQLINGKVVFNAHRYSPSTGKHQSKVRDLLSKLNIKIDLIVDTRESLHNPEKALESAIEGLKSDIQELEETLKNTRRKKALDQSRNDEITSKLEQIREIKILMAGTKLQAVL